MSSRTGTDDRATTTSDPSRAHRIAQALPWLSLAARLTLAGVLGYAALTKIGDPSATVRAVRAYRLLPEGLVAPFAHALPAVELVVAVLLLLGVAVRLAGVLAGVLMAMFLVGVASADVRGLKIDCGCFGGGGPTADPQYATELFRDGVLFVLAIAVVLIGRSRLALDPQLPAVPVEPAEGASRAEQRQHRAAVGRRAVQEQEVRDRRRWFQGGAVATLVVAALIGIAAGSSSSPPAAVRTPTGVTAAGGVVVGSPSAPHHLIAYEDPQCPICKEFEKTSGPVLTKAVAAGTVSVEYRMRSFLGPESVRAVAALGAAEEEGRFEQLREQMFAHQPAEKTGGYTIDDLLSLGRAAGLTDAKYTDAVRKQTFASWAKRVDDQGSKDGNVGTPELRLDGKSLTNAVAFDPAKLAAALGG